MKKMILSLTALICCVFSASAQTDLVATLSHGSNISTYTGIDGLSEAYTAAENGDVITLSPGVFNSVTIEKAITVRGAGMKPLESNGYVSTQLTGNITINVPSNTSSTLTLEGVQVLDAVNIYGEDLASISLIKNRFEEGVTACGINMTALACIFASSLGANNYYLHSRNTTLNCMNCVIRSASASGLSNSVIAKIVATNCDISLMQAQVPYCVFSNCIIASSTYNFYNYPIPETCSVNHCIGINAKNTPNLFSNLADTSNKMLDGGDSAFANVFQTLQNMDNIAWSEDFKLTDAAAATYLGDDGKQVGIYGGTTPFNATPSNPQIKNFAVSSTTTNGKLAVKINVE